MRLIILISILLANTMICISSPVTAVNGIEFTNSFTWSLRMAEKEEKYIFAYIYADWSVPCRQMEEGTFKDSVIIEELNRNFINLKVNMKRNRKFSEEFEVHVFPTMMIIDRQGNAFLRFSGFKSPDELLFELEKTKKGNRYLSQDIDSLVKTLNPANVLEAVDSIRYYRDEYTAKNLIKKYLDKRKDWSDSVSMKLIFENFNLDKKYLKYLSRHHKKFYEYFDSLTIRENIAFHVFINSIKQDFRGRPKFNFRKVKRWFRRFKLGDVDKMEDFVRIKYLLWGRGPSVRYSVNLIKNYPETTDENVLFASVIRLLIYNTRRSLDYDELIQSIESTLDSDVSYWRYDALSLLYYKTGRDKKAREAIESARLRAENLDEEYTPTLDIIKEHIERE